MPKMTVAVNAVFDLCAKRSIALYLLLSLPLRRYNGRKGQEAGGTEGSGREIDMFYSLRRWRARGRSGRTNERHTGTEKEGTALFRSVRKSYPPFFISFSSKSHNQFTLCKSQIRNLFLQSVPFKRAILTV